ncbi:MAG: hypothetical protein K9M57_08680 [Phycisphaerae bacterium]|nr:hypothetical protein [Phycisphaerae bacterium]
MKKKITLLIMLVIIPIKSVSSDTITINAYDSGNGQITIGYTMVSGTSTPLTFGLRVTLSNGATLASPSDVIYVDSGFPIYIDHAYGDPGSYNYGIGHPLAETGMPGELTSGASSFTISLGSFPDSITVQDVRAFSAEWLSEEAPPSNAMDFNLDGKVDFIDYSMMAGGGQVTPASMVNLITLQLHDGGSGHTEATIQLDYIRGGIIGTNEMPLDTNFPQSVHVVIPAPCNYILTGDLDGNCKVDIVDFALMATNWLTDCDAIPTNPVCIPKQA